MTSFSLTSQEGNPPDTPPRLDWRPPRVIAPNRAPRQATPDIKLLSPTSALREKILEQLIPALSQAEAQRLLTAHASHGQPIPASPFRDDRNVVAANLSHKQSIQDSRLQEDRTLFNAHPSHNHPIQDSRLQENRNISTAEPSHDQPISEARPPDDQSFLHSRPHHSQLDPGSRPHDDQSFLNALSSPRQPDLDTHPREGYTSLIAPEQGVQTEYEQPPSPVSSWGAPEYSETGDSDRSEAIDCSPREDWRPPVVDAPHRAPKQPAPDIPLSPIPPPRTPRKSTPARKSWRPPRVAAPHRAPRQPTPDIALPPLTPLPEEDPSFSPELREATHYPQPPTDSHTPYPQHNDVSAFEATASNILSPKSNKKKHGPVFDPKRVNDSTNQIQDPRTTVRAIAKFNAAHARARAVKAPPRRASEQVPPLHLPKSPGDEMSDVLLHPSQSQRTLSALSEEMSPQSPAKDLPVDEEGSKLPAPASPSPRKQAPAFGNPVGCIQRSLKMFR